MYICSLLVSCMADNGNVAESYIFLNEKHQGGLATAFDLAAFRLSVIAPVKKSVNHPKTVASMRGTGWENKFVLTASSQRFGSVK